MVERESSDDEESRIGAETEYATIREEILSRIRMRQHLIAITLTLGGAFVGAGLGYPSVALVYPPLAAFLTLAWAQNDFRIRDLAKYIREKVEPLLPAVRWESYIHEQRRFHEGLSTWRFVVISHGGLFLFTQALATYVGLVWLIGWSKTVLFAEALIPWTLFVLDIFAIFAVIIILTRANR